MYMYAQAPHVNMLPAVHVHRLACTHARYVLTVDTSEAGLDDVDVTVACLGDDVSVQHQLQQEHEHVFTLTPTRDVEHVISAMLNGRHVRGSIVVEKSSSRLTFEFMAFLIIHGPVNDVRVIVV